jgi:hypothetical protein
MKQLAEIRRREGNKTAVKVIQQENKRDWKIIQEALKPLHHSGINSIEENLNNRNEESDNPYEATSWIRITDPSMIEDKLLTRNIKHFGQAQGSLFTTSEIQEQFDYKGVTNAVNLFLRGTITTHDNVLETNGARTLFKHLADKNKLPEMSCNIDITTFTSTLRKWAEKTSTSPSGRHLEHYKCHW